MQLARGNFKSLEGLRAYMAWTVVLSHVLHFSGYDTEAGLRWLPALLDGTGAVNVFIVVSGFVITHLLLVRHEPYGPYLVRRALRIIPIYYLCLLLALLLLPAQIRFSTASWIVDRDSYAARFAEFMPRLPEHLGWHITLLHGVIPDTWLPEAGWSILGPAWSLSLEWQFYVLAPLILYLLRGKRLVAAMCVVVLLAAHMAIHRQTALIWRWPSFLPISIHFFLLGILCRLNLQRLVRYSAWVVPSVGVAAALVFGSLTYELLVWTVFLSAVLSEVRASAAATAEPSFVTSTLRRLTQNRLAVTLGRASYSTYLVHIPFLAGITSLSQLAFGLQGRLPLTLLCVLTLPVLALLSIGLYEYVESPFIRLGARLTATPPAVPTEAKA